MSHREDLLDGAVECLRSKGYAKTTARDIVAASGTNLASIGYHYGSTQALLNAAVVRAMDEFGTEIGRAMAASAAGTDGTLLERFERFWTLVLDSIKTDPNVWAATFDMVTVAQREPDVRALVADGLEDGRLLWSRTLLGEDEDDRGVGAFFQALLSGVLAQCLIDPERAPTAADLAHALAAIAGRITTP